MRKGIRWMPWHCEAKKDVLVCEKLWGADKELRSADIRMRELITRVISYTEKISDRRRTQGTETSKYL